MFKCAYCKSRYEKKLSLGNHQRFCSLNPNKISYNKKINNNQYTKAKSLGLEIPINSNKGRIGSSFSGKTHSLEVKEKLSMAAKRRNLGGVRQSKRISYKDKILGSSYELKLAISLDENNIKWNTCKKFNYVDKFGRNRTYQPDFYLEDYDLYLDPKNDFLINNINPALGFTDKEKIESVCEQNNIKVLILDKNQLDWKSITKILPL